jgi:hypothetical protein
MMHIKMMQKKEKKAQPRHPDAPLTRWYVTFCILEFLQRNYSETNILRNALFGVVTLQSVGNFEEPIQ